MKDDLTSRTIDDFGDLWTRYTSNEGYYASPELLADVFGPLLSPENLRGKNVLEIGSGTGRIVHMLLSAGAAHVTSIEPSRAMDVLKANTASFAQRITYLSMQGRRITGRTLAGCHCFDRRAPSHSRARTCCFSSLSRNETRWNNPRVALRLGGKRHLFVARAAYPSRYNPASAFPAGAALPRSQPSSDLLHRIGTIFPAPIAPIHDRGAWPFLKEQTLPRSLRSTEAGICKILQRARSEKAA